MLTPQAYQIIKDLSFKAYDYEPHDAQRKIHACSTRFVVAICGRRFGKSVLGAQEIAALLFNPKFKNLRIWIVAPTYDLTDKIFRELWAIMLEYIAPGSIKKKSESKRFIKMAWGSIVECKSADNPDSLVGDSLDLLVIDEAAKINRSVWEKYLRPTLTDRNGRALFITTPEGKNWLYTRYKRGLDDKFPHWTSFRFPSLSNPYISHEDIEEARRDLSPEAFRQEYEADFFVLEGRVYKTFFEDSHVTGYQPPTFDRMFGGIDYGYVNPSAIEVIGEYDGRYYVVDEVYASEMQIDVIHAEIKVLEKKYGRLPWFADHKPEYNKYLQAEGVNVIKANKEVEAGINCVAGRFNLDKHGIPGLIVNKRCENLIEELESYRYDPKNNRNTKEKPLEKDDHAVDALRYAVYSIQKWDSGAFKRVDLGH